MMFMFNIMFMDVCVRLSYITERTQNDVYAKLTVVDGCV